MGFDTEFWDTRDPCFHVSILGLMTKKWNNQQNAPFSKIWAKKQEPVSIQILILLIRWFYSCQFHNPTGTYPNNPFIALFSLLIFGILPSVPQRNIFRTRDLKSIVSTPLWTPTPYKTCTLELEPKWWNDRIHGNEWWIFYGSNEYVIIPVPWILWMMKLPENLPVSNYPDTTHHTVMWIQSW